MTLRIEIDEEVCIGSGNCVQIAPQAIELDDEGVARVVDSTGATPEQLRSAERSCPTGAITIFETDDHEENS